MVVVTVLITTVVAAVVLMVKIVIVMEYLTQVTDVLITLIQDAIKKVLGSGSLQAATGKKYVTHLYEPTFYFTS
jgi:hypothetical protein